MPLILERASIAAARVWVKLRFGRNSATSADCRRRRIYNIWKKEAH
jgi:hypothetical protein